jgi:hypothetical protein
LVSDAVGQAVLVDDEADAFEERLEHSARADVDPGQAPTARLAHDASHKGGGDASAAVVRVNEEHVHLAGVGEICKANKLVRTDSDDRPCSAPSATPAVEINLVRCPGLDLLGRVVRKRCPTDGRMEHLVCASCVVGLVPPNDHLRGLCTPRSLRPGGPRK